MNQNVALLFEDIQCREFGLKKILMQRIRKHIA